MRRSVQLTAPVTGGAPVTRGNRLGGFTTAMKSVFDTPLAITGLMICIALVAIIAFAPLLAPYDPNAIDFARKLVPPSTENWLGTDEVGRDLLSRILYGTRLSVLTGVVVLIISAVVGSFVGAVAGYVGGGIDEALMRISDFFMAFPYLILAMAIAFALGASMQNAILAVIVVFWPSYARLVRGQIISIKHLEYVEAAQAIGASHWRIIWRHIMPQTFSPLVIKFSLDMGFAVVALASLGFIGLGAQPPQSELGTIIAGSRNYSLDAWWYAGFPGAMLLISVLGFNLIGDSVQASLDRRLKK